MPTRNDIYSKIAKDQNEAPDRIRRKYLADLAAYTENDVILYSTSFINNRPAPF